MNRFLILISFLALFHTKAFSMCMPMYFSAWPQKDTIVRNPLIILSFYERTHFKRYKNTFSSSSIAKGVKFFLKAGNEEIPLRLIQQNSGQSNEKQLVFKPIKLLKPNTKYRLSFSCKDSLLREEFLEDIEYESQRWITNEVIDKQIPVWLSKPEFLYKNYVRYGCGPESYWRFCMKFKDDSEIHVQTIVRHLETGKISEYYLYPDSNSLFVGYGMCGGEFDMIPGERYSVSFNLVDASGNSENRFSEPIFVQAPRESDYLSEEELDKKKCYCDSSQTNGSSKINIVLVLSIVGFIVLISFVNWYRNSKR